MKCRVLFSLEAKEDADAIQRYLRQFSANAPVRFRNALREKLDKVKENPYMYEEYRYRPKYRSMPIEKYLLFYEVNEQDKIIYVYRILHGAQDIPAWL